MTLPVSSEQAKWGVGLSSLLGGTNHHHHVSGDLVRGWNLMHP